MKNDSAKKTKPPLPFKKLNSCVSVGRGGKKLLFCFPPSHLIFFLGKKTKYLPSEILLTMIYKGLGLVLPISSLGETPSGVVSPAAGKKAFKIIFIFRFSPVWDAPLAPAQRPCALGLPPARVLPGLLLARASAAQPVRGLLAAFSWLSCKGCFYFWSLRT